MFFATLTLTNRFRLWRILTDLPSSNSVNFDSIVKVDGKNGAPDRGCPASPQQAAASLLASPLSQRPCRCSHRPFAPGAWMLSPGGDPGRTVRRPAVSPPQREAPCGAQRCRLLDVGRRGDRKRKTEGVTRRGKEGARPRPREI